jgi:DNA-binding response OmpR family regulator
VSVLIVEDEERLAAFLVKGIEASGYRTNWASTGAAALASIDRDRPELVILDLGLPDMDGSVVLTKLRELDPMCPTIILTARGDPRERVLGLDLGADDYLPKPFSFAELLARMRAVLRRTEERSVIERDGVKIDLLTQTVSVNGEAQNLSPREIRLLEAFLRHPGEVLSRPVLLSEVWGLDFDPGSNLVDVYVRSLRRKVGNTCIQTVRGQGYRFAGGNGSFASE